MKIKLTHTIKLFILFGLSSFYLQTQAQDKIKGITMNLVSSQKINGAIIKNIRTNKEIETDKEGNFIIDAKLDDYLAISANGYEKDTVFVYDFAVKRIYLNRENNAIELSEVYIERLTDSRLANEIKSTKLAGQFADVSQQRGGILISPSRVFSKEAKQSRNNYKLLLNEQQKRTVDHKFTDELIQSVTPLEGSPLALFKEQYRPKFKLIEHFTKEDMKLYIMDSYKKFNTKK